MAQTAPFSRYEWMIAWRYLRARKAEGGVSIMTIISLVGISLAVFAMLATLAVRSGYRSELIQTVVGANAHLALYGNDPTRPFAGYEDIAARVAGVDGVVAVAPIVVRQALVTQGDRERLAEIHGISLEDLKEFEGVANSNQARGDIDRLGEGIAIGIELARELGVLVGDEIDVTIRGGAATPLGRNVRVNRYEVVYIFSTGRADFDAVRAYIALDQAQLIFDRDGMVDRIALRVADPSQVEQYIAPVIAASLSDVIPWTWKDSNASILQTLDIEDAVMFLLMSILVLIAVLNIISGLIMLVKNKGRDIGILRTIGLTEGAVMRVFFICGASIGTIATLIGVGLGSLFVVYFDQIFNFVVWLNGGEFWDPERWALYKLPVRFELSDVLATAGLSLGLSWIITIFPSRRAARMNPVEALRYE